MKTHIACCVERVKIFYEHELKAAAMKRININMDHKYLGTQRHAPTVNCWAGLGSFLENITQPQPWMNKHPSSNGQGPQIDWSPIMIMGTYLKMDQPTSNSQQTQTINHPLSCYHSCTAAQHFIPFYCQLFCVHFEHWRQCACGL